MLEEQDERRVLALIAHDGKKADMVAFAIFNRGKLSGYHLIATATTGQLLATKVGLEVESCLSGPRRRRPDCGAGRVSRRRRPRRRVTARDVAAVAGVSIGVVSRAFGGYTDIAPATRERILRLARDMGYHPSERGRLLKAGRGAPQRCAVVSLGTTAQALSRSFVLETILSGIVSRAGAERLEVHLVALPEQGANKTSTLERLVAADTADGFIFLTHRPIEPADVAPLDRAKVPYVLANRDLGGQHVACVTIDRARVANDVVERLVALGHRRMATIVHQLPTSTARDHEAGWRAALAAYGIAAEDAPVLRLDEALHEDIDHYRDLAAQVLRHGLPRHPAAARPTALACFSDHIAYGVLQAAAAAGVHVPGQLSVIGFDDLIAPYTTPQLCTYNAHLYELGAAAATLLAQLLRGEASGSRHLVITPTFVCRKSCGPAPTRGQWAHTAPPMHRPAAPPLDGSRYARTAAQRLVGRGGRRHDAVR